MKEYFIFPQSKPRMTKSDKWKKRRCVIAYWAFKDRVKQLGVEVPESSRVIFYIPMPSSWSKKKQAAHELTPHQSTPDIDNLLKGLLDAVYEEDKKVWNVHASKYWRTRPGIAIEAIS